ncbi:MAG TPA: RNA pyrophosphohydrolase [Gammaproteobacteria bacterium]|nr:RNA pyrophosphohydrolase [Gammaproteobacteria bacterium]
MFFQNKYRPNVAVIVINKLGKVLWCQRIEHDGWQFPQGGIDKGETPEEAALREVKEEVGLDSSDIEIIYETKDWFKYEVPQERRRKYFRSGNFLGQKQKWFLAKLLTDDTRINLKASIPAEFDKWIWSTYWHPLETVVAFKRETYRQALIEMLPEYNKIIAKV